MKSRRKAREVALQALYQCDSLSDWSNEVISRFFENFFPTQDTPKVDGELASVEGENLRFAEELIFGVRDRLEELDREIVSISANWSLPRMARIDRNLLRLATFEILYIEGVPVSVSINEAIEIAKRFSGDDAPMFINGVLDQLAERHNLKEAKRAT